MNPPSQKKVHRYNNRKRWGEPITSFGLILFNRSSVNNGIGSQYRFLLQQRRDTFEYMDFIRGMWRSEKELPTLFTLMSVEERIRIEHFTFHELWEDLFVDKRSKIYEELYPEAKGRYDSIAHLIPTILKTTETSILSPPWGFPKGRKNHFRESEIECAIRETEEETRISHSKIEMISPLRKYSERFQGTNGQLYARHYFLAKVDVESLPEKIIIENPIRKETISEEAQEVEWLSYEEACKRLNVRRQLMLREALLYIRLRFD